MAIQPDAGPGAQRGIRLDGDRIHVRDVTMESAVAARVLRRHPIDDWVGVFGRLVDYGGTAYEAANANTTVEFVREQLSSLVRQARQDMSETASKETATLLEGLRRLISEYEKTALNGIDDRHAKEVRACFAMLSSQLAVRRHVETATPVAGVAYEEAVFEAIVQLAKAYGDTPEHCAATLGQLRRRTGDIVVTINAEACRGTDLRLVWELKRRAEGAQRFTLATIRTSLGLAKRNRSAQSAGFIVEDAGLLPAGSGGFLELPGADFATVCRPGENTLGLTVAYRLGRSTIVAEALQEADGGVDLVAARRWATEARAAMARLDRIRALHASAITAIGRAGTQVEELGDAVLDALRHLEDVLGI